jgi:hypothetical protein
LTNLLASEPLQRIVSTTPRVSYEEAQSITLKADLLFLIQPGLPLQVPRKLYEYMAVRKPILCIAEPDGATGRLVRENGLGFVCGNSEKEIEATLREVIATWRAGKLKPIADDRCEKFKNRELSKELHRFIGEILDDTGRNCP